MKYELNRSYNGGGVVYVLKARHLIHPYSMYHKELFYRVNSNNSIKLQIKNHPAKPKYPQKRKTGR